ncbi:MAG: ABC transporter ATP-binding protein [Caulobacteraceae bacterium]
MTAALELIGVDVDLAGRPVLEGVSLDVAPGEVMGVLGANGSGKTTLLRAALGLLRPKRGEARLAGRPVGFLSELHRASLAAYLPQERRVGWNMPAWRVAALGAVHRPPPEARRVALNALAQVGMAALADRGVRDMSGGERARVLIARLIATGAPLLIADEPAAGLDPDAQFLVMDLLRARAAAGVAVLVTLHDLTLAARSCDRLAVLAGRRLVGLGPPAEVLTPQVLSAAFGLEGELIATAAGPVIAVRRGMPGYRPPPPTPSAGPSEA